jgi:hypothetical protein
MTIRSVNPALLVPSFSRVSCVTTWNRGPPPSGEKCQWGNALCPPSARASNGTHSADEPGTAQGDRSMETTTRLNEAADNPRSRRALLAGVVGGVGAWLVSAAQRAMPVEAAAGNPILAGRFNSAGPNSTELRANTTKPTFRAFQLGSGTGLRAESTTGRAVMATAGNSGTGVLAYSPNYIGVLATTKTGISVNARAAGLNSIALFGDARGRNALALFANGPSHFAGDVSIVGRLVVTTPATVGQTSASQMPSSGDMQLFARDNGRGKTQLCVQFASGAVQILATEP